MRQCVIVGTVAWAIVVGGLPAGYVAPVEADEWMDGAEARIEKRRKADARVVVVDASGKRVSNADVEIEQTHHAFLFGCNIFMWGRSGNEREDRLYREQFASVCNFATLPFYWPMYERRPGEPDHERTRQIANWCRENGIVTKGHPLAWNFADPHWLPDDLDEIRRLQMARIDDCVEAFKGRVDRWDVVNEATHFDRPAFKDKAPKMTAMWEKAGRIEFTQECFKHARQANADATLLINDYRTDSEYEALIEKLVDEHGKPIYDVIGIQSHQHAASWDNRRIWDVCERFARFGVPLHFTETTFTSGEPARRGSGNARHGPTNERRERWQADEVERFYTMLFSHPAVEAITWWDFSDRSAWQGAAAGFLRKDMSPKPSYHRLLGLVKGRWWTKVSKTTDASGEVAFRGFLGDYRITVKRPDGGTVVSELTLSRGDGNRVEVKLGE
ncbi:MAG: endo-1,4-beta-xylanase [Pirellulaceae bacterium]